MTTVSGACFPTPVQEQVLRACFLPPTVSEFSAGGLPQELFQQDLANDPAAATLLPLLDWRWADSLPAAMAAAARSRRLTLWRQGRDRLELAASIAATLRQAGIDSMLLKGAALIARYYDPGVRGVGDVDLQVPRGQVRAAVEALLQTGWTAEGGLTPARIESQMRARHAWQFYKPGPDGKEEMCDVHWHPVVRCYSPRLAELFLEGAETVTAGSHTVRIPCATDLLFHAAAHGLQWSWTSPLRWIPDAWFVIRSGAVDWQRLRMLAAEVDMTFRVHRALEYLKTHFDAAVPEAALESLAQAPRWEAREQTLLEKPSPLGMADAARWHLYNFRRLRRFDPAWKDSNAISGFVSYLTVFFQTQRRRDLPGSIWRKAHAKPTV
ncbi:MAG TPA: nucleotidyltransferase family protein [Bryobacteraceae bacterium]|nr:nucleotidyltransferase family protein [Bryobacteraceae bacterium]